MTIKETDRPARDGTGPNNTTNHSEHNRLPLHVASREVSATATYMAVAPLLVEVADWPLCGTPAWVDLDNNDPRRQAAVAYAALQWTLQQDIEQEAERQASHDISSAYDWGANRERDAAAQRGLHPAEGVMTDDIDRDRIKDLRNWYAEDNPTVVHSAHLGMAVKLAEQFDGRLLYVETVGWHRWDGTRWAPGAASYSRRAVHTVIKRDRAAVEKLT